MAWMKYRQKTDVIDVHELAEDNAIWTDKDELPTDVYVRRRLANVRARYLGEALVIDTKIVLNSEVEASDSAGGASSRTPS